MTALDPRDLADAAYAAADSIHAFIAAWGHVEGVPVPLQTRITDALTIPETPYPDYVSRSGLPEAYVNGENDMRARFRRALGDNKL